MKLFVYRLNLHAVLASLFAFSFTVNALHGQTLGSLRTKRHVRLRTDKQVVLESSPEHSNVTLSSIPTSTLSLFNLSNTPRSTFTAGGSDAIVSPQSTASIPLTPTSFHEPDACSDASSKILVMGYYPDWADPAFPPEHINFTLYDWIDFAFALPDANCALVWDDMVNGPKLVERLVTAAHAGGSKVKLSIGGWTGSKHFSSAVATVKKRKTFASNILAAYRTFNLDGIDLDWEYPGKQGAGENSVNSEDTRNFLSFLTILRATLPSTALISAAAQTSTFLDADANPMTDLTDFAKVLDWVTLMNYDVWSSSSEPGPNAPLHDGCGNSTQPDANAVAAFQAWTAANFPSCKLVLGLPSYGYISTSQAESLRTRSAFFSSNKRTRQSDSITVIDEDGGSDSQVQFRQLVRDRKSVV